MPITAAINNNEPEITIGAGERKPGRSDMLFMPNVYGVFIRLRLLGLTIDYSSNTTVNVMSVNCFENQLNEVR